MRGQESRLEHVVWKENGITDLPGELTEKTYKYGNQPVPGTPQVNTMPVPAARDSVEDQADRTPLAPGVVYTTGVALIYSGLEKGSEGKGGSFQNDSLKEI